MVIGQKFLKFNNFFKSNFLELFSPFLINGGVGWFFCCLFLMTSKRPTLPNISCSYHKRTEECKVISIISSTLCLHIVLQRYNY